MKRFIATSFTTSAETAIANFLKTMGKGKITAIGCFSLLLIEAFFIPVANALDGQKLYQLCSRFPLNSQCQGYEAPIPLDNRSGKKANCIVQEDELEKRGICKITVNETGITIYQETGKGLEVINDKKATRAIQIPPTSVSKIEYREDEKDNTGARVVNTILFGIGGLLLTRNAKVSEIQINYTLATPQDTNQGEPNVNSLRVIIGRNTGREMRSQLEKITGRQAEIPETKKLAN